jgi:hypothetical protein
VVESRMVADFGVLPICGGGCDMLSGSSVGSWALLLDASARAGRPAGG